MRFLIIIITLFLTEAAIARECNLPEQWQKLCSILEARVEQTAQKMKLKEASAKNLEHFLNSGNYNFVYLPALQNDLPKTTLELLIAINERALNIKEADLIAKYLQGLIESYNFQNVAAFDENTSHIIGRDWDEIDYSGENMTWQGQKAKYASYNITDFKSVDSLKKFFTIESKLPYFNKIYKPQMLKKYYGNSGCIVKKNNQLLVVKVSKSDKYDIPSGKPEGVELAYKTAERETKEETGIKLKAIKLLEDFKDEFYVYECHIMDKNFTIPKDNSLKVPNRAINEISEARFIEIDKLTPENVRFPSVLSRIKDIFKTLS
ncbi:NUDIX hydrolase [Rickettsia endosymbiont of Halotydeus destructor]|uniref:NUDIX hydrolase n=1 Tax=Rickettsia endosymbiont of Halotydeus destructor TaxID=2996754 RepID=UPI003BAF6395